MATLGDLIVTLHPLGGTARQWPAYEKATGEA